MSDLRTYVRHAERYGPDLVFEAAAGIDSAAPEVSHQADLDVLDLGRLSLRLQNIAPRWRLARDVAFTLARQLLAHDQDVKTAARMSTLSVSTVRKVRAEVAGVRCPV